MNRTDLTFDAAKHEYRIGNRVLPHVTEIVRRFCPMPYAAGDWYLQRGTAVHAGCALLARGKLDWASVDTEIRGKLSGAKAAMSVLYSETKWKGIEKPLCDVVLGFAGTLDLFSDGLIVDWKSSIDAGAEMQLGGYSLLLEPTAAKGRRLAAIELCDDGTYRVHTYHRGDARQLFRSALTLWNWQKRRGLVTA